MNRLADTIAARDGNAPALAFDGATFTASACGGRYRVAGRRSLRDALDDLAALVVAGRPGRRHDEQDGTETTWTQDDHEAWDEHEERVA